MRQRIGVTTLGIIGGLLVLLVVAAVGCDDPEPTAVPTATATTAPTVTPAPEPSPTPTPLTVEALAEATYAAMGALETAHIEGHITMTARVTGEEEGTVEMSMVGDYQAPDRTRLSVNLTIEGNDFEADYTSIANETYIQVPGTYNWQVSDSSDGLDLRETLRFDPDGMENLVLIGEEELDAEKVYHLRGSLASDAGGLLNSVPGALVGMTPLGEVVVKVEFWIGVGDFLVRRTIQNIAIELSSDIVEGGELNLELDMRLSDYGDPVDIQAPDVESTLGTEAGYSEATPIPAPSGFGPSFPCGPQPRPGDSGPHGRFIEWTPRGSHIVFDDGTRVMMVDVEGTQLGTVVDANPGHRFGYGLYADLSPDGSQIVYSSCEYPTDEIRTAISESERQKYHYEIATVALDGSVPERLTENDYVDHYPVWSPDMTRIAFLSGQQYWDFTVELRVMWADGSHQRDGIATEPTVESLVHFLPPPPVWSPDGERIAFIASDVSNDGLYDWPYRIPWVLYTVGLDGSGLSRISEHTGGASWSPDGQRLAVARIEGEDVALFTIAADGSDSRKIIKITDRETSFDRLTVGRFGNLLGPVSWSPDGTRILYICEGGVCVVDLDGNPIGQSPAELIQEEGRPHAAWSPDGLRIAIRSPGNPHSNGSAALFTMARDGTDVQVLVRGGRSLVAANSGYQDITVGIASCTQGFVVPNPQENPGLVKDCETLMGVRDTLAGDTIINWSPGTPIEEWEGVILGRSPSRVTGLDFSLWGEIVVGHQLSGVLPPGLGELEELETLSLFGNRLSGDIPPELSKLTGLRSLDLKGNRLSGCIPSGLRDVENNDLDLLGLAYCTSSEP